jgi:phage terminase small subunit
MDKPNLKIVSSNKKPDENKLTKKQLGFIESILDGKSLVESYLENYQVSSKTKNSTIRHMASQLRANPNITQTLNKRIEEKKRINLVSDIKKEELILNKLTEFMNNEDFSDSARVRSAELIGKHYKLFTDVTEVTNKDKSTVEVEQQLREKLGKLLEK